MVTLLNARAKNELYDRVFVCLNLLTETHMIDVLKNAYVDNSELNRGVLVVQVYRRRRQSTPEKEKPKSTKVPSYLFLSADS